jgi:Zn-finger nucleic acid-binding protein
MARRGGAAHIRRNAEKQERPAMQCPIDGTELVITDRSGVEIDYCPKCRGVWLDRGELDKIIDRSVQAPPPPPQGGYDDRHDDRGDRGRGYGDQPRRKKRGGFLEDLFDF